MIQKHPTGNMYQIQTTEIFDNWLAELKDLRAKAKIIRRLERAEQGNLGQVRAVGSGVSEMKIDEGKGYRLYYTLRQNIIVLMLIGGDKSSQQADIQHAIKMKEDLS